MYKRREIREKREGKWVNKEDWERETNGKEKGKERKGNVLP